MEASQNKVVDDLQGWRQMEDHWKNLLGPEAIKQRYFMAERLRSLKEIHGKYTSQRRLLSKDEKIALNMIKGEIRRMEKFLYPNRVVRVIVRSVRLMKARITESNVANNAKWKPSISPIAVPKEQRNGNGVDSQRNGTVHHIHPNRQSKNENIGPARDLISRQTSTDSVLLEKVRTGKSNGLKK